MASFKREIERYQSKYGTEPRQPHADWENEGRKINILDLERFFLHTGAYTEAADDLSRYFHEVTNYEFLVKHLKVLKLDAIALVARLMFEMSKAQADHFLKKFCVLRRAHQIMFLNSLRRLPNKPSETISELDKFFADPKETREKSPGWTINFLAELTIEFLGITEEEYDVVTSHDDTSAQSETEGEISREMRESLRELLPKSLWDRMSQKERDRWSSDEPFTLSIESSKSRGKPATGRKTSSPSPGPSRQLSPSEAEAVRTHPMAGTKRASGGSSDLRVTKVKREASYSPTPHFSASPQAAPSHVPSPALSDSLSFSPSPVPNALPRHPAPPAVHRPPAPPAPPAGYFSYFHAIQPPTYHPPQPPVQNIPIGTVLSEYPGAPVLCYPMGRARGGVVLRPGTVTHSGVVLHDGSIINVPGIRPVEPSGPGNIGPGNIGPIGPQPPAPPVPAVQSSLAAFLPPVPEHHRVLALLEAASKHRDRKISLKMFEPFFYKEKNMEFVLRNLQVKHSKLVDKWPRDTLPREKTSPKLEKLVNYAMTHAFTRHYQLVPRFQGSDVYLHCSRMAADSVDEGQNTSDRASCEFALKISKCEGKEAFRLERLPGARSFHNHRPNIHPSVLNENDYFHCDSGTRDTRVIGRKDIQPTLAILEEKSPTIALYKLLRSLLVRAKCDGDNLETPTSLFFAHTEVYRHWRAYPEILLIDNSQALQVDGQHWTVVIFKGVDCHNLAFPIAVGLVKKSQADEPMEMSSLGWIFTEIQDMQLEYSIESPGFIQSSCELESLAILKQLFPESHVHADASVVAKHEEKVAAKHIDSPGLIRETLDLWHQIVGRPSFSQSEESLNRFIKDGKCATSSLIFSDLKPLFEQYFEHMSEGTKRKSSHFGVDSNDVYINRESVACFDTLFQAVRAMLQDFAQCYEYISEVNGREYVKNLAELSTHIASCKHIISFRALKSVQQRLDQLPTDNFVACGCPDGYSSLGYPCVHELQKILSTRGQLSPDDFHPHWRNLYADTSAVSTSGAGRFTKEWRALKTGADAYRPHVKEGYKDVRLAERDKENVPPNRPKSVQGSSEQPIEL